MKDQLDLHAKSQCLGLTSMILGVLVLSCFVCQDVQSAAAQTKNLGNDEIFNRFRPLAMDESWTVVKKSPTASDEDLIKDKKLTELDDISIKTPDLTDYELPKSMRPSKAMDKQWERKFNEEIDTITKNYRPESTELIDVEEGVRKNVSAKNNLFSLPQNETTSLTTLITGKEAPTFVHNGVVSPASIQKGGGKVLASYKILIPIYIPALKKSPKARIAAYTKDIKYTKETHTEMVPMKKNVVRAKTFIKAEPVPQKVITHFVKSDGNSVPSSVDDKLKPNEKVLKSVVTDF